MKIRSIAALVFLILSLLPCLAAPYAAGDRVAAFSAEDQHGKAFTFEPTKVRFLLVSHDMDAGKAANAVLTTLGDHHLPGKKAIYLANIHGMPKVGRMFALPKMRKYAHRIILGDDAALISKFPETTGKVTVLKLSGGKVSSVKYWDPATEGIDAYLK